MEIDDDILDIMIDSISDAFMEERKKEEPYKELWKAGSTQTGLLRELETKMTGHVSDACEVYKERHGIRLNHAQYCVLLALPLLVALAEKHAMKHEGQTGCVDKAYYLLSKQILSLATKDKDND